MEDDILFQTKTVLYTPRLTLGWKKVRGYQLTLRVDRIELERTKVFGNTTQTIPYRALSRVTAERGLVQGSLTLQWGLANVTLGELSNAALDTIEQIISERIATLPGGSLG